MNPDQYYTLKNKHLAIIDNLKTHKSKDSQETYRYLTTYIEFDDCHKKIYHSGNNMELIKCYFYKSNLTKKKEKILKGQY